MSVSVRVSGDKRAVRQLNKLAKDFPQDAARALNKTATRAGSRVRRQLAKSIGLPAKLLKTKVQAFKTNARRLKASVWIGTRSGIPLGKVPGASASLSGVLKAGRTRTQAFRATMPNGYTSLFVRKPGSKHRTRPDGQRTQLPIEEPRIRLDYKGRPILDKETRKQMSEFYPKELQRLIKRTIDRRAKRSR